MITGVMPLGEVIAEVILRPVFELVFYGVTYWTGFVFLKVLTCGAVRLAPLDALDEKRRGKRRWYQIEWGIWLERRGKGRMLRAEFTCLVGMLLWLGVGLGIYFANREDVPVENKEHTRSASSLDSGGAASKPGSTP